MNEYFCEFRRFHCQVYLSQLNNCSLVFFIDLVRFVIVMYGIEQVARFLGNSSGIPQGMNPNGKMNTVEEGEVSIKAGNDKYIFIGEKGKFDWTLAGLSADSVFINFKEYSFKQDRKLYFASL